MIDEPEFIYANGKKEKMEEGPTAFEYQQALQYFGSAMQKGHLQTRHRVAMLHETGIFITHKSPKPGASPKIEVLERSCDKALKHYKWIVENASPHLSQRLRKAY